MTRTTIDYVLDLEVSVAKLKTKAKLAADAFDADAIDQVRISGFIAQAWNELMSDIERLRAADLADSFARRHHRRMTSITPEQA